MSNLAISAHHLAKMYHIGGQRQNTNYSTLRDSLAGMFRGIGRRREGPPPGKAELWALKDISFDVPHGQVVGIIGRNGAGKSTLLKVLSRITEPTKGQAELYGRVASLLEVGTGFHPELTGRENIYLNGAVLGMRKQEIDRNFDAIVAFSEVEKFIDTPVKFYSSGMYVRLAFAVAAHLEPEILIVDEVLAVGDARFQKKCMNKMQDVGSQGRTVLFVSHSMQSIMRMCERTILLDAGTVIHDGPSGEVIGTYLGKGYGSTGERRWDDSATAPSGDVARLRAVRARNSSGEIVESIDIRQPMTMEIEFEVLQDGYLLMPHFHVFNEDNVKVFMTIDLDPEWRRQRRPKGRYVSKAHIPGNLLAEGTMFIEASVITIEPTVRQFTERDAIAFQVVDNLEGDSARGDWAGRLNGVVRPKLDWTTTYTPD
ncbi:MAG: ABC transporter ATP-binding protein [Oscillochloris sp.]|nr:ABC transporter ATP-binding protein [Oscillochloris sp.]